MLNRKTYFIRERVGFLKFSDTYDILDPATGEALGIAQEKPRAFHIFLRLLVNKSLLPTRVNVYAGVNPEDETKLLFAIRRGFTLFRSRVDICNPSGQVIGWFQSKVFSLGGAFRVFDAGGHEVALVKGDWKGWNFRLLDKAENEIGAITKKWAGIGKELFTTADNYIISLSGDPAPAVALLLLAAGLAVDTVYKERN